VGLSRLLGVFTARCAVTGRDVRRTIISALSSCLESRCMRRTLRGLWRRLKRGLGGLRKSDPDNGSSA